MFKRCIAPLVAALLVLGVTAPSFAAAVQTPQQIVQSIADQLAHDVQGQRAELGKNPEKTIQIINSVILPHFDTNFASLLVLGRYARQATPAQRVAFSKAFYNALTHRYGQALLSYTQGAVKVLPSNGPLDAQRTLVRTEVALVNGNSISVDYAFRKTASGQWKAYDVIIAGISYIANYRNQVAAQIQKEGIDGLIKQLQTQGAGAINQMKQPDGGH